MQTKIEQIQPGWAVIGSDNQKVGDINEVGPNYLLITKGLFFPKDLYIPFTEITDIDATRGSAYINVAKDDVESMGWDHIPAEGESRTTGYAGGPQPTDYRTGDADTYRVPVHEEELQAEKRATQAGEVQVEKNVVEEERGFDVPVTREEVDVRRRRVDREVGAEQEAFTAGSDTIRVPVTEEEVEVSKRPRVVEEIEISKRPVTETRRVADTVRREEVDVRQEGSVRTTGDAAGGPASTEFSGPYSEGDAAYRADAARDTLDPATRRGRRLGDQAEEEIEDPDKR